MYLDHEGNRIGDISLSWGQPNTRVHTILSRRRARQGPGEGDVQMPISCLPEGWFQTNQYKKRKTCLFDKFQWVGKEDSPRPGEGTGTPCCILCEKLQQFGTIWYRVERKVWAAKALFERLYLVLGLGKFWPWFNCPYEPTTPTVHSQTISSISGLKPSATARPDPSFVLEWVGSVFNHSKYKRRQPESRTGRVQCVEWLR